MEKYRYMIVTGMWAILLWSYVSCRGRTEFQTIEETVVDSLFSLSGVGIDNPVVSLTDSDGKRYDFYYESGKLTGGNGTSCGSFFIHSCPLLIESSKCMEGAVDSLWYETIYENIRVNERGFITSMEMTGGSRLFRTGFLSDSNIRLRFFMSYNADGCMESMRVFREGQGEVGNITYVWNEGDLVMKTRDSYVGSESYEEHEIYTYSYLGGDSVELNTGIYLYDVDFSPYIPEYIWYTGMLGKPTKRIPERVVMERVGDGGNVKRTSDFNVRYDEEGFVVSLEVTGRPTRYYDYLESNREKAE